MLETITQIIAEQMDVQPESITLDTRLVEDLHADSIDAAEMIINIESALDKRFEDEVITELKTVRDIVEYLEKQ